MSNRNFDSRVIIQRLQDKNYARNLYQYNTSGQRLLHNPQNSNSGALQYTTYHDGSQTMYFRGLIGGGITVDTGGIFGIPPYPGFGESGSGGSVVPVITVPTAPIITSISSSNQQLMVSFLAPLSDGGSIITDYQYSTNINAFSSIGATVAPFIITGLTNGTTYDVALRAINTIGAGQIATGTGTPSTSGGVNNSWAVNISGQSFDQAFGITSDINNNIIGVGYFTASTFINSFYSISSNGIISTTNPLRLVGSGNNEDALIVKYTSSGTGLWATNISGTPTSDRMLGVITDSSGNIYTTGRLQVSSIINSFNSIIGNTISTTSFGRLLAYGNNDIFISKYDTNGLVQWATNIGGTGIDQGNGITKDNLNNIYVVGTFITSSFINSYNSVSSNGVISTTTFGRLTSVTGTDAIIAKYNSSGTALWATNIGGTTTSEQALGVATDIFNNVYVTGLYNGTASTIINSYNSVSSNGVISTTTFGRFVGNNSNDLFVVKYNSSGTVQWATNSISSASESGQSIITDMLGNVYVAGVYTNSTFINSYISSPNNNLISTTLFGKINGNGSTDALLIKYNSSGTAQWATNIGGISIDEGLGIVTDTLNNVYITGRFTTSSIVNSFNTIVGSTISTTTFGTLIAASGQDVFIAKYNSTGAAQWATTISGNSNEISKGITLDTLGNIYVIGDFNSSTNINSYAGVSSNIISTSYAAQLIGTDPSFRDIFIVKYNSDGQFVI